MLKIEVITLVGIQIFHRSSSGRKEIKLSKSNYDAEGITYVENYVKENDFKIINATSGSQGGDKFYLIKE